MGAARVQGHTAFWFAVVNQDGAGGAIRVLSGSALPPVKLQVGRSLGR